MRRATGASWHRAGGSPGFALHPRGAGTIATVTLRPYTWTFASPVPPEGTFGGPTERVQGKKVPKNGYSSFTTVIDPLTESCDASYLTIGSTIVQCRPASEGSYDPSDAPTERTRNEVHRARTPPGSVNHQTHWVVQTPSNCRLSLTVAKSVEPLGGVNVLPFVYVGDHHNEIPMFCQATIMEPPAESPPLHRYAQPTGAACFFIGYEQCSEQCQAGRKNTARMSHSRYSRVEVRSSHRSPQYHSTRITWVVRSCYPARPLRQTDLRVEDAERTEHPGSPKPQPCTVGQPGLRARSA